MTNEYQNHSLSIRACGLPFRGGIALGAFEMRNGKRFVGKNIVLDEQPENGCASEMCQLSIEQAKQLMDDLYHAGIRPSEVQETMGALRATEKHLEDMRKLVFERKP